MIGFVLLLSSSKHRVTVVTHSIPSIMRSLTTSQAFALIFRCTLSTVLVLRIFYLFIKLLYSVEGIRRSMMIWGFLIIPGIIICGFYISSLNPYTSRLLFLLLSIICCFTMMLTLGGYVLNQVLCSSTLIPINTLSFNDYFIPITHRRRNGICLRFTGILLVISMFPPALILVMSPALRCETMLSIVPLVVIFQFSTTSVCSFYIIVDIGLESSDSIYWSHLPPDLAREIVNRMTTFKDYIAAIGVNQDWRSARSSISRGPQLPLPVLMLSEPLCFL